MQWLMEQWSRVRAFFTRGALDRDMAEQMRLHIELQAEANERAGMSPEEAMRAARVQFGSLERFRAECRDARRFGVLEDAVHDGRFAVRGLVSEPSFSVAALLALSIGIGAATTIYSLADHVLLRPVPGVRAADELVTVLFEREPGRGTGISYANLTDLAAAAPAFAGLAGIAEASLQTLPEGGQPLLLEGEAVAGDYFGLLGVAPALGRFFSSVEVSAAPAEARVAVISHGLWQRLYGGEPDVLGRRLHLNTHEFTIIGVAPRAFRGPRRLGRTDVWLPGMAYEAVRHFPPGYMSGRRASAFMRTVGRLAPGATPQQAEAQLRAAMAGLVEQFPEENAVYEPNLPTVYAGIGTVPLMREWTTRTMKTLGFTAALVLLIGCANVANLLLFRGMRRRVELAVRRALGADTQRIARQSVVEGLLLSMLGCVGGALLALLLVRWLRSTEVRPLPPLQGLSLDLRVLVFAVGIVLLTGLLFGLLGAATARGGELQARMRTSRGTAAGAFGRTVFLVVQVAASVILLAGGLLLVRSVGELRDVDTGIDADGVSVFGVMLEPQGYDLQRRLHFNQALLARLASDPRVDAAATSSGVPVIAAYSYSAFRRADDESADAAQMQFMHVSDQYFAALGMQLSAGRALQPHEAFSLPDGAPIPAILTETAARDLFGNAPAVGRLVTSARRVPEGTMVVVGVTADVRRSLREPPEPGIFLPQGANPMPFGTVYITVRSQRSGREVEQIVQAAVGALEPALPFWIAGQLRERIDATLATERLLATIITGFALLAMLLAGIGLYGVVAYGVAQQRREIGIRSALGARPVQLAVRAARNATVATAIGALLGAGGAFSATRLLETWLFGVNRLDPFFYLGAAGGLTLIAMLAAAVPAYGAASVQPTETLRLE